MKVDLAKRRRIMQRSMKLGHCICDPRRPCPCDVFKNQGICPCAGERPEPAEPGSVKLTELVHNAGCASKIAPADLEAMLARLPAVDDPAVISGLPAGDDAGVYALADGVTLVQTVDVFTPCVDDAQTFGRICAANCLSDVYAMGAVPRTALSILGFPSEKLDGRLMYEMMKGAMDALAEANVALIGGHSIKDDEIKLGFAITGTIDRAQAVSHETARVGDVLILTKPLGVGVLNFARQIGRADAAKLAPVAESMATLNKAAAEAMQAVGASACTDVTGFGLFGHLISMVRHSGVTAQIHADALPAFEGAVAALADGVIPGAIERNREYVAEDIRVAEGVDEALVNLGFDAQTSGGLLIAVPQERYERMLEALAARGVPAATIGRIVGKSSGKISVTVSGQSHEAAPAMEIVDQPGHAEPETPAAVPAAAKRGTPGGTATPVLRGHGDTDAPCCAEGAPAEDAVAPCCADVFSDGNVAPSLREDSGAAHSPPRKGGGGEPESTGAPGGNPPLPRGAIPDSTSADALKAFGGLMRATGAAGAIDARAKELVNFALVVLARCEPCLAAHVAKARSMGITRAELDEAAWCAVAMGGAPVKMFYEAQMSALDAPAGPGKCCG